MRATETVLRNLLQGEKQYIVPLYQRTYSWKREQLDRLWSDITELAQSSGKETHFMGSIVLAPSQAMTPSGVQNWLVVDGQQRLTTLSILLCAIRDYVAASNPQLVRKIDVQYLTNEFADGLEYYKMLPTQADRAAWQDLVNGTSQLSGQDNIGNAYRFFRGQVELLSVETGEDSAAIQRLEKVVTSELSFVEISAQVGDNVYRIFESLNNTGLKLTQADLLRNYLFMRLPVRSERVYQQHWLPLQSLLDDQSLVDLIWLDLVLRGNRNATQRSIYEEQHKLLERLDTEEKIEEWVVALYHKARIFRRVLVPEEEPDPVIRAALDRLRRWRAKVVHPIALHILLFHDQGKMSPQEVSDAMRAVESYLVRQLIVGIGRTGSNVLLADLIKTLGDETPFQDTIIRILTGQRRRFPTDQQVRTAMLDDPFYWRGKEWQKAFILRSLDEHMRRAELVAYEASKLTIEHVMPQTPTDPWLQSLNKDLGDFESAEDAHQGLVHTIGNLTLSAYNGSLSNKSFEDKKKILSQSGLAMNLSIAEAASWGVAEIRERSEYLANLAVEIWPGPTGDGMPEPASRRLARVKHVLSEIPSGRWTNYLSLAQAAGTHRRSIGRILAEGELINSHRVLRSDGSVSALYGDPAKQIAKLSSEGVFFDGKGRASRRHHIGFEDLIRLTRGDISD